MKKWKLFLVSAVLLMLLLTASALADNTRFGVVVNVNSVNLRAAPSTNATKLGTCAKGTWVTVLGSGNGFYQVETANGTLGWIMQSYLHVSADATGTVGYVTNAGYLNLRKSASTSSRSLGQYDDGTPCVVLNRTGNWYYVSVNGQNGYFLAKYISTKRGIYSDKLGMVISPEKSPVNLRSGPGMGYSIIASVPGCTYVMVLQQGTDWCRVSVNGKIGFMSTDYLHIGYLTLSEGAKRCGSSSSGSSSTTYTGKQAVVNNPNSRDKLNLRRRASKSSTSLGKYSNGTVVTLISRGDQWCKVKTPDGQTGYMMTDYLTILKTNTSTATRIVRHPDSTYVNLRSKGSTNARILTQVPHGASVVLLSEGKTWSKVRYNGYTGYMMTKYLKKQ